MASSSSATRAAAASPEPPQRLTCEFTMPSCQHASIFNDVYLRTNRTNHTKIMRCFPHCCPEHRRRSYCGSSLHLKIQPNADQRSSKSDDKLVVYARFRPIHVDAMPIGTIVSVQSIQSSLQSKDPSKGEWVECVVSKPAKGAPPTTESMYEVNPSGRWYYPWSGAATIAMRATEHVFEALVFRRSSAKQLELVGVAVSSLFRLMSFRRGLPTATKTGADGSDESPRTSPTKLKSAPRAASPTGHHSAVGQMPQASSSEAYPLRTLRPHQAIHAQYPGDRRRSHEYAFSSIQMPSRGSFLFPTPATDNYARDIYEAQHRRSPEAAQVSAMNTMETLMLWLHEMPASSAGSRSMLAWQTMVQQACEAHVTASRQVASVRAGLVPILSALDIATAGKTTAPAPRLVPPAVFGSHGPTSPLDSIDAAVRVLLHEWLDVDCSRVSSIATERLVLNGFLPTREELAAAHDEWLRDVTARAQRYVHAHTGASWSQLMATISRSADNRLQQQSIRDDGCAFSHRSFVAQWRQQYMRQSQRYSSTSRATKRQRTDRYHASYRAGVPYGLLNSAPVWSCSMEDVSIEMAGMGQQALSLLTVVQFWKHLSCLRLDFAPASSSSHMPAQLSVASVFNTLVRDGSFTKLTLDGQYRWFNCLPSGEPTIGTTLMGYVVGDYVGRATSAGTIHITTYLWPATAENANANATAFAWHWTIDAASLTSSGSSSSVVSVVVESASLGWSPHAMETMSMTEKLRCVGRWQHACELRMAYHKQ